MLCGFTPFWDGGSPVKIYENILKGRVKYPPYIHHDAQDLLVQLITADLTKRLGNLHGGSADVKNHAWYSEVNWERLVKKDIDAPYVPPVKGGAGDASQFDKYEEEREEYGKKGEDPYVVNIPSSGAKLTKADTAITSLTSRRNVRPRSRYRLPRTSYHSLGLKHAHDSAANYSSNDTPQMYRLERIRRVGRN
jgi:serine/threonine protein kinase